jgi:hypothetical protein
MKPPMELFDSSGGIVIGGGQGALGARRRSIGRVYGVVDNGAVDNGAVGARPNPVTAVPGLTPRFPLMTLGRVLVTVDPARTA